MLAALALSYRLREAQIDLVPYVQLLEPASTLPPFEVYLQTFIVPSMCGIIVVSALLGMYGLKTTLSAWREVGSILLCSALWLAGVMIWFFLVRKQLFYSRILLLHGAFLVALFLLTIRSSVTILQRSLLRSGIGIRRVMSFGSQPVAIPALQFLDRDPHYMYLGHLSSIAELLKKHEEVTIDLLLQTDPSPKSGDTLELIDVCRSHHIGYAFLPPVLSDVPHLLSVEHLGILPMIRFSPTPIDGWGRILKRLFDCCAALVLLLILLPFFLIIALLCFVFQGSPIFYVSDRIGERSQKRIPVLKFRTMIKDADAKKQELLDANHRSDGPLFKMKNDPRITRLGRILRSWSIDEWPQLINVLMGHMSLVGPRPHLPHEVKLYTNYQRRVFAVKPGVTGLAQISGRSNLTFNEEVSLDLKYVENWSPLLDLWILWRTLIVVTKGNGAD